MSKRTVAIVVFAVLALAALFLAALFLGGKKEGAPEQILTRANISESAAENVVVPEKDSQAPKDVAKPSEVAPASYGSDSDFRHFNIQAAGGKFTPSEIRVYQGDNVQITFAAVDRDYDVVQPDYGKRVSIKKGASGDMSFGATAAGKFTFYCASCGGPAKGPVGYIVVVPK